MTILAETEEMDGRADGSMMNVNKGLDKDSENLPLSDIVQLPVHALQGLTEPKAEVFAQLGVKTIQDLGNFKYCQWAEAMATAAKFEE